jgi:hypothetical protein
VQEDATTFDTQRTVRRAEVFLGFDQPGHLLCAYGWLPEAGGGGAGRKLENLRAGQLVELLCCPVKMQEADKPRKGTFAFQLHINNCSSVKVLSGQFF